VDLDREEVRLVEYLAQRLFKLEEYVGEWFILEDHYFPEELNI